MNREELSLELECPVCYQTPRSPPIFQCENGHLICCVCHPKMSRCPQGKCNFSGVRCRLAENILEKCNLPRPCKFSVGGCLHEEELVKLELHEANCSYRPVYCPDQECCEMPKEKDVLSHLMKEHFIQQADINRKQTVDECLWVIDEDDLRKRSIDTAWPISPWKNKEFTFFSVLKKPHNDKLWYAWIYVLGSKSTSDQFKCKIRIHNSAANLAATFEGQVHSIEKGFKEIVQKSECLIFTDTQVRNMMTDMPRDPDNKKDEMKHLLAIDYKVISK